MLITGEYVLLCGGLAIVTAIEVDKKVTKNLFAALSPKTNTIKTLATMTT